ncbi:Bacterio-opsin activator HTH domain protein [Haloterrigena turkmenica DSM 5511]|uniref:Bacterio-opsin activator HTH domain protein n=1 Tax=Haloterrigena turkmenica (strain ATCC 51198 / DSM 5511 / JCM 9101 / NCIMB 13204 / VKM B-1734 / 4k) TaxID=543526 RepID=D2RQB1_HALTV|nr:helix-turn-helix domain-containing protein [Haloterrigena turkmenica]ADB62288.1 Bacterio-opsin activator HTH domain protein [Haloterrigena turkmenica DSM 5511]
MATEATFTVPSDQFPLGSVFERLPDVTIELERMIPARDVVVPYFWVRGTPVDDIEDAFDDHPGVVEIELIDSVADEYLLRVEWSLEYAGVLSTLTETKLPLVKAIGTNREWTFDVRGDDRADIADFQQRCRELDIPITLTKLHALTPIETEAEAALTEPQQEAVLLAYERGYFNSPRDVTMAELGDELGITQQAVASRLRRGIDRLVGSTLAEISTRSQ